MLGAVAPVIIRPIVRSLVAAAAATALLLWPGSGRVIAAPATAPGAPAPAAAPTRGGPNLLAPLPEGQGRVFGDAPDGTVKGSVGGKPFELEGGGNPFDLKDGEMVKFVDDNSGIGMGEETVARVVARKKKVNAPNGRIILENRLHRSPDGKWAVFSAFTDCGDFCYANGWLFGNGLRLLLSAGGFGPDVTVAWRADGKEVAVGSRALFLVSLPDGKVTHSDDLTSPAYGPDSRLFVRASGAGSDAVYEWVRGGKPRKILTMRGGPPQSEEGFDAGDPAPVTFASDGALTAEFERGEETRARTVPAAEVGKTIDATQTPRPPAVEKTLALIVDPATAPAAAAAAASTEGERTPGFAHELAVAANTRGYRLYQQGNLDGAQALFIAAAGLDVTYGMPRYNLARLHAVKRNAKESAVYLRMLKIMGKAQRARLQQATRDDAFKAIADSDEFRAVFK
jgi:hypothetical protein